MDVSGNLGVYILFVSFDFLVYYLAVRFEMDGRKRIEWRLERMWEL